VRRLDALAEQAQPALERDGPLPVPPLDLADDALRALLDDERLCERARRGLDACERPRRRVGVSLTDAYYQAGALAALESFRDELVRDRGHIENELEPPVDVVLDLLNRIIAAILERGLDL
jgi:hypothetical protein